MSTNCYDIKIANKCFFFVRTDTGRWYDIAHHRILKNGLVPKAKLVPDVHVAEIAAKSVKAKIRRSTKRQFQKQEVV